MKKHFLLICFLLTAGLLCAQQQEQHYFQSLDTDDGLPHNFIIDLLEDRDGIMWISTPRGLSKYNGQSFTNYTPHVKDSTIKKDRLPFIWNIFEDSNGQIWLGADNGLFLFDKKSGRADCFAYPGLTDLKCEDISTSNIYESREGDLYFSTTKGVLRFNSIENKFIQYQASNYNSRTYLAEDSTGQIWGAANGGIFALLADTTLAHFDLKDTLGSSLKTFCLRIDDKNRFWLATVDGLYRFLPVKKIFEKIIIRGFGNHIIIDISVDKNGNLYLATQNNSLIHWNPENGEVVNHYLPSLVPNGGPPSNFIQSICQTKDNSIWLGTNQGIGIFQSGDQQFRLFAHPGKARNKANNNSALSIDSQDYLWFSNRSELNFYRKKLINSAAESTISSTSLSAENTIYLVEDNSKDVWFSMSHQGVFRAQANSLNLNLIKSRAYFGGFNIRRMVLDAADTSAFWIATDGGLCHFNTASYDTSWIRPTLLDSNAKEDFISKLTVKEDGSLWFFNSLRLCNYQPDSKNFACVPFEPSHDNEDALIEFILNTAWSGDHLYIATRKGLVVFNANDQSFALFEEAQGNSLRNILSLIVDNLGSVWLSRKGQLIKYVPHTASFEFFSVNQLCDDFKAQDVSKYSDGRLVFATKCGLLVVDPSAATNYTAPPKVVLSNFRVRNQPYELEGLPEWTESVELSYLDNFFTIDYTALEYLNHKSISYRYKLVGLNEDWVMAGNNRSVNFANLAPGEYTFLAEATSADGNFGENSLRLPIRIRPAYWQTIWFKAIIVAILFSILLVILRVHKRARQLAADKKLAEQNSLYKSKFLANVSHEIRTPLNAILGINSLLMESTNLDQRQQYFTESIHLSCEKLLAIINDLLDQAKIESGKFSLNPQPFELRQLVHQIDRLLAHKFREKKLTLSIIIDDTIPKILIGDAIRLFQILMNLTGNALKFTEKGLVMISIKKASQADGLLLNFSVKDTGVGIPSEKLETVFNNFEQLDHNQPKTYEEQGTGLGLSIAKELIELQGGSIEVTSTIGKGTTFYFSIPFKQGDKLAATSELGEQAPLPTGLKVLVVDDTPINQFLTTEILKKHLPEVHIDVAANGEVAIDKVGRENYDLVLMDVRMPVMGGIEATRRLRSSSIQQHQQLPIIGLTSDAIPQQIEACKQAGMNDCLSKPVQTLELIEMIRKQLNHNDKP